eukprot:10766699-Lingulodinium_polyedra.AAC.1
MEGIATGSPTPLDIAKHNLNLNGCVCRVEITIANSGHRVVPARSGDHDGHILRAGKVQQAWQGR